MIISAGALGEEQAPNPGEAHTKAFQTNKGKGGVEMATQLFSPRRVVVSFSLQQRLAGIIPDSWEEELEKMLNRHIGDWGEMDQSDLELNDNALNGRASLFSAYHTSDGTQVWIITEWDHSYTKVLLPEDY